MNAIMTEGQSISAYGSARSSVEGNPLEPQELQRMQAYWNATLFLSAGMIYLRDPWLGSLLLAYYDPGDGWFTPAAPVPASTMRSSSGYGVHS